MAKTNDFVDILVIDTKREKAWVFGYDGHLTMNVPDSLYKSLKTKVQTNYLRREKGCATGNGS